jgi:GNAT superfamily N-acetyltransferase
MKQMGANFVRLCHYPHDPRTLDLCDEIGLLVMCEIPLYWWGNREEDHAAKLEVAKRQLTRLIMRDRGHPSVIFWSVSNETSEEAPEVAAGNAELVRLAKQFDPKRLATHVSDKWTNEPRSDADDVICVNSYPTWSARAWQHNPQYEPAEGAGWWRENLAKLHERYPGKPIVVAEFGYPAIEGVADGGIGEAFQAETVEAELRGILGAGPYVSGATIWCWADHPWAEDNWINYLTTSPFGVVARDRRSKQAAPVVERLFKAAPGHPSLFLRRPSLDDLPALELPDGYTLRTATDEDAEQLGAVLKAAFPEIDWWGTEGARKHLLDDETVKTTFVIEKGGRIVATASARLVPDAYPGSGYVHWVGADPEHRGKRLGFLASLATLHEFVRLGCKDAVLETDDFRLPAIKVYFKLGFAPEYRHATHAPRWARLGPRLGESQK